MTQDPHVDPHDDGENVFIIGLDSDTVLTLCPAARRDLWQKLCTLWDALTLRCVGINYCGCGLHNLCTL